MSPSKKLGLPTWHGGKKSTCQCRRWQEMRFDPWVGKIPRRRKWQPTPVFFPGKFHGQRSLVGYSPWGPKESDMTEYVLDGWMLNRTSILNHWLYSCFYVINTLQLLAYFSSVQLLSHVWLFVTPWTAAHQASLSITNSWSLLKLISIESVMPSNHLVLCCHLLLPPSIFPSIRVFSNESVLHIRWPKYWSFSFSIRPSNEDTGLISFRMDWVDLLAVQRTLKNLLQHHSSKASILWRSAFFILQLSDPYMILEKR